LGNPPKSLRFRLSFGKESRAKKTSSKINQKVRFLVDFGFLFRKLEISEKGLECITYDCGGSFLEIDGKRNATGVHLMEKC